jgi:hypothetical protein
VTQAQAAAQPVAVPVAKTPVLEVRDVPLDEVLRRATAFARQSNVKALQQLRDQIVQRRTAAAGTADVDAFTSALDQLDRDLDEARRRQLELDGRQLGAKP